MTEQQILQEECRWLVERINDVNHQIKNLNRDAMYLMAGGWGGKRKVRDLQDLKASADRAKQEIECLLKGINETESELEQAEKEA